MTATSTDDARKLLTEKLSHSIMENREELLEALKAIDGTGDETDEQVLPALAVPIITAIVSGAVLQRGLVGDVVETSLQLD
ncbi:hypothetical protein HPB52_009075 [Rhipicephalus sanguineus]|uniref:Uncharacterized protein n=1 Tax=Rhipicephalus sanguineus TaxID=34632 RepID=A0A9D4SYB2_RHISA|nr:hypothetical protein HPB52_009075 [Rhipicephalus sanguineus]